jgi:hypothetical protein
MALLRCQETQLRQHDHPAARQHMREPVPDEVDSALVGRVADDIPVCPGVLEEIADREAARSPVDDVCSSRPDPACQSNVNDIPLSAAWIM